MLGFPLNDVARSVRCKIGLTFCLLLGLFSVLQADTSSGWKVLAPGMELRQVVPNSPGSIGDSRITVLRIDPSLWQLEFVGVASPGEKSSHTAHEWSATHNFTAAINAGMFDADGRTHLGYLRYRGEVNNDKSNSYQSVAAFDPTDPKHSPGFHIFDLDDHSTALHGILKNYNSAVQNLRLIKRPGVNQWTRQSRKWSEAALGEDNAGRILFIFCRSPFSMHDLNQELLSSGIGLVAAQHLEGGPEAQLYVNAGGMQLEMFGSYETAFREDDGNSIPWPVPNILGVRPRTSAH